MSVYGSGYEVLRQFAELSSKSKTVSSWRKKKIPVELRKQWYKETVVEAIAVYNFRCEKWLKEHGE